MNRRWMACVALLATLTMLSTPWLALAQSGSERTEERVAKSEKYASQAFEAYRRGEVSEAVSLYLKALEQSPSANILYNLAKIYDLKVRDRALAMQFYRRYIADPGADPDRVREVNARLIELRNLELAADQPNSGVSQGAATGPNGRPEGGARQYSVRAEASAGGRPGAPVADDGMSGLRIAGIVTGAVGVAGLGTGLFLGLRAQGQLDDADCNGNVCRDVDKADQADRSATFSTVAVIGGAVLTATGVVLFVLGGDQEDERKVASTGLSVQPLLGPNVIGSHLSATW